MSAVIGALAGMTVLCFLFAIAAWIADHTQPQQEAETDAQVIEWPQIVGSNVVPLHRGDEAS